MPGSDEIPAGVVLTSRQREVVQLLAEGKSNKEVANCLGISTRTAEGHRSEVMKKLRLGSLAELIRYAIRNGMCSPSAPSASGQLSGDHRR